MEPPFSPPSQEQVDWIDDQGQVLGVVTRARMRAENLLHRVSSTLVTRADGRVFVQKRTLTKDVFPGLWDVFVGGTVASGETFEQNARRELGEELGIFGVPVLHLLDHTYRGPQTQAHIRVFTCRWEGPVTLQPEEVAAGHWAEPQEVDQLIAQGELCPDSAQGWGLVKAQRKITMG
ncbi:MAG: NUDIX domain-containing protein [Deltaproteobacteria bacterium]|nr:NUDIX domain-containing protein [Deltaproteobacteria bacterium]